MDRDSQVTNLATQSPIFVSSDESSGIRQSEEPSGTPPDFHDLTLPDYLDSSLRDFDMEELIEADVSLSDQNSGEFELESAFASSPSSDDKEVTRESSFATSNSSSG